MIFDKEDYKAFDPELWNAIDAEAERQQNNIELIASENVVSKVQGQMLCNLLCYNFCLFHLLRTWYLKL